MAYLIGVDEAGYGPNIGPLVIGGTVWQLDQRHDDLDQVELYDLLQKAVARKPSKTHLAIADSKAVYGKRNDLSLLEEAVFASAAKLTSTMPIWRGCCEPDLEEDAASDLAPWYEDWNPTFPLQAIADRLESRATLFQQACEEAGIGLTDVRCVFLTEKAYNKRLTRIGNKSTVLSHASLGLLRKLLQSIDDGHPQAVRIVCDKHGGRDYYAGLLQHFFPDAWWKILEESRGVSRYFGEVGPLEVTIEFRSKGEGFLPTALASLFAKYHREVAMKAINRYWAAEVPGIAETAGYPVDAARFAQDTEERRKQLKIEWETFWRLK
ncbi:hypothetical protein ACYFX5_18815 [Bremerella sp. T1]|uniref:hypothetical protein n=1 Tax=Bremerella sp. TYQ1 TaxID=3119568 RepID=UPI001CCB2F72|nr:hypothetical protein [Bremerella volcania]UBM35101.1 hypothetical protein LA756_20765 [Bremerella volcania]